MPKKKRIDFVKWMWIGGVPAALGAIGFLAVNLATYIELPNRVATAENGVEQIEDWIKEQQVIQREQQRINKYYYEKEKKSDEVIYSPDGKWYWNTEKQEWRPIKELEND